MPIRTARLDWLQSLEIVIGSAVIALYANISVAQITPDGTLPNNSNVTLEGRTFNIIGGSQAGGNLFHSFQDFSVPTGSTAFFHNAADIQNIINRVTGGSISNIDGLIRANGTANLFLINPNGIIFGENARLDIGGSFFATSANSMKFADGFEFSTKNPQLTPLLTINVPIGLQFGANPGLIQVRGDGTGIRTISSELIDIDKGLQVKSNQTLALVGGDISLEGAILKTPGGRIELGSVGDNGFVHLTPVNKGFSLGYAEVQNLRDIQLSQQAAVDANGEGGGDIQVMGRHITLIDGSRIQSRTLGSQLGGSVVVNGLESVNVIGQSSDGLLSSLLATDSDFNSQATSTGTDLTINTRKLLIQDGAVVSASTFGAGYGGKLTVNASDSVEVIGLALNRGFSSSLLAQANSSATGSGGELTINTGVLLVQDGAQVAASTFGDGKSGNLTINASKQVRVIGTDQTGRYGGLFAQTEGKGNAGSLTINTASLIVQNGSQISAGAFNEGNGGKLSVNASQEVQVIGVDSRGFFPSALSVSSAENSQGNAGDLIINTPVLLLRDGGQIIAGSLNAGQGGNLTVNADNVRLIGTSFNGRLASAIATSSEGNLSGDAGNLTINTRNLSLENGGAVIAATFGQGKGGNLTVNADNVQLIGTFADGRFGSQLSTSSGRTLSGDAGNLTINTRNLLVKNGAQVLANTDGQGKGGNLIVNADNVQLIGVAANGRFGSGLFTSTSPTSTGDAGDLKINTRQLLVQNRAGVFVNSQGRGNAGNLTIDAESISLDNGTLSANTRSVNTDPNKPQATITLQVKDLLLLGRSSNITTNARGENVIGGDIKINTNVLAGFADSNITANSTDSRGGNVAINTKGIFGIQFRDIASPKTSDITATGATRELSGNVEITTPDIDPTNGLVQLPINLVDAYNQISNACKPGTRQFQNTFVATGRGGLPINPTEPLQDSSTVSAWVRLRAKPENFANTTTQAQPTAVSSSSQIAVATPIVEASDLVIDSQGKLQLVAEVPQFNPHSLWQTPASCPVSQ
ncbi:hypothetical protein FACHB389_23070 [Nostoc calcicola FACHB-389]|nr:S-layer family protein [Nostoc calcicola FACHB-3891]OKH30744.1 hypothetical protein FACHB389_23070 [Nostoc calcicola FACHB-389]